MKKQASCILSILLTLVMLTALLPVSAQAATRPFFSVQPQDGTALKTEGYQVSWETAITAPVVAWMYLNPTSRDWAAGGVLTKDSATLPYKEAHCLPSGIAAYKLVAKVNTTTSYESDPFEVTWVDGYRVTFDANGGTGTMASEICAVGEEYTLPECTFTAPARMEFDGWSVDGEKRAVGYTITVSEDTTVTALWKDIPLAFVTQPENGTSEKGKPCTFSWQLNHDDAIVRLMVYNSGEKKWETLSDDLTGKTSASYSFAGGTYCTGNQTKLKLCAAIESAQIESEPFIIVWSDFLTYNTWVLGTPITEENMADVLGDGKISYTPAQGTAPAKLTLNSVYIDKPDISGARSPIDSEEDLIIEFKGGNTVNGQSVAAIYSTQNLYLQSDGTGSLTAYGPNYVIWTHDVSMSISGLKELNLSNKNAIFPALYAYGGITISDCGTVTSNSAIDAGYMDLRLQNSKIQIQARDDDPEAAVLRAGRKLTISNAQIEITAASESVKNKFSGIYTQREGLTISAGSTVSMTDVKNGIVGGYTIAISDSDVSVSASECAIRCSASQTIELTGCAINTTKTPAEISGYRVVKPGTEEIATAVVIERSSAVMQHKVTVTVNNSAWGSVQVFGLNSDGKVDAGSAVTLRATAKVGCRFVGWKVGDTYLSDELEYAAVITEPTTITAEFTDELVYDTHIMGVQVSSKNMNDVLGDGKVSYVPAQGTIPAVLTLKGVDLTYETSPVYTQEDLTVEVRGKNKLKSTNAYGIELNRMDKNLYINGGGTGSLTIESYNNGITSRLGKVYLNGLKELDITAGIDHSKFWGEDGIYTFTGLSIKDCALIRANNCLSSGNGEGQVIIKMTIDNSRVEVRMPEEGATQGTYTYRAIDAPEGLEIINGSYVLVEASNPTGNNRFNGIYAAYDKMEISDSYVKVKDAVDGIYGGEGITINRSHIYIEASEDALVGCDDLDDPDLHAITLNGCELTMPNTKLLTTVRDDYDDITQVVDADTEQPALKCSIGTTISEIKILGFTPPASGAVLDKTNVHRGYTEELASYRVNTNTWHRIDPATGTETPMSNGDEFEAGGTYRYRAFIVRRDDAFDAFPASAEGITVTIEGLPAGCEMDVYFNSTGTVLTCDVLFVLETTISGEVTVNGSKATAHVTVENLSGTEAILIIAQYSGGQMKAAQTISVTADGTFTPAASFTHAEGCTYKAFLLGEDTYAPLCAAAPLSVE